MKKLLFNFLITTSLSLFTFSQAFPQTPLLLSQTGPELLGQTAVLGGCVEGCMSESSKDTAHLFSDSNCYKYCRCVLSINIWKDSQLRGWEGYKRGEAVEEHQKKVCRAKVWPTVFTPPPPLPDIEQKPSPKEDKTLLLPPENEALLTKQDIGFISLVMLDNKLQPLVRQAMRDGIHYRISCSYGPFLRSDGKPGYGNYNFWYRSLPDNFADWRTKDNSEMTILRMGGVATIDKCPLKNAEAATINLEGREKYKSEH